MTYNFVFEMVALKKKENVLKYMTNRRQKKSCITLSFWELISYSVSKKKFISNI